MGHSGDFPPSEIPQPSVAPAPHTSLSKQALRKTGLKTLQPPLIKRMAGGPPASQSPEELVGNADSQVTLAEILTSWVQSGQRESENHVSQGESKSEPETLVVVMQRLAPVKPGCRCAQE